MHTRLDLSDLRLFLHVAEAGSITAGAQRAHLALASASARIHSMEDALGVQLLTRQRHGVQMTEAGRALLHHARAVLRQLEHMRNEMSEYAHGLKGHIRLLGNTAAITEFLPDALGRFLRQNPFIDIDLEERLSHEIVQAIVDGVADIGIVADSVDTAALQTLPSLFPVPAPSLQSRRITPRWVSPRESSWDSLALHFVSSAERS